MMNAGPINGNICFKPRCLPLPSRTNSALATTLVSPFLLPGFMSESRSRIRLSNRLPALNEGPDALLPVGRGLECGAF